MKLPQKIVDANVILRFFLGEDERLCTKACAFMEVLEFGGEEALLTEIVFAEVVWVLNKVYKVSRPDIAEQFAKVIGFLGIKTILDKGIYLESLRMYGAQKMDIQDIILAVMAKTTDSTVVTFDKKDFKKLGCEFSEP